MKDGLNEYLEEYYTKGQPRNEPLPALSANSMKPISKPRSLIGEQKATAPLIGPSFARSELPALPVREYVETEAVVTLSSMPNVVSVTNIKTSSVETWKLQCHGLIVHILSLRRTLRTISKASCLMSPKDLPVSLLNVPRELRKQLEVA